MVTQYLTKLKSDEFNKFLAHWRDDKDETLFEHSNLVFDYVKYLITEHGLMPVINNLIAELIKENISTENKKQVSEFLLDMFNGAIVYHDAGKLNPNFQTKKEGQKVFKYSENVLKKNHSKISGFFFLIEYYNQANKLNISGIEKLFIINIVINFAFPAINHHQALLRTGYFDFNAEFVKTIYEIIDFDFLKTLPEDFAGKIEKIIDKAIKPNLTKLKDFNEFPLFALLKLNYSLLTASDYLATSDFMNKWKCKPDLGVLSKKLKQKIIDNAKTSREYNKKMYCELENYELEFPKIRSNVNLNKLRQKLSVEIIKGIRADSDKNLFYIEAPTGSGKTNLSMLAIAELLNADLKKEISPITKIFYVFPFTTLITQTYKSIKETFDLESDEIIQIHSKAGFHTKQNDGQYGSEIENFIDYIFVNYPVALLSHIRFFNILKSNSKQENYLLHRLANSVVVIDELQTYAPAQWDKVIYFIDQYARFFNIKFILMSATLPKLDRLLSEDIIEAGYKKPEFIYLNQNKNEYFTNPNFAERISFDFNLIEDLKPYKNDENEYLTQLKYKVLEKSGNYLKKIKSDEVRVHTIIEFIFKKTASKFYKIMKTDEERLFDEIFLLSGSTLEPRRKEIISKLKSDDYKTKSILLVTTQVVEAGVDIDMDVGFKDSSLIDSDEQLAGRINRNVKKTHCTLYLFNFNKEGYIYNKDDRYKIMQNELSDEYENILKTKNFDIVYNKVMEKRSEINKSPDFVNLKSYLCDLKKLHFEDIDKNFKLIDTQNTNIYVPIDIDIEIKNSDEKNFEKEELDFLQKYGKYNENETCVNGEKVWELYENIRKNKSDDFTHDKIKMTIIQGILSKFSFSIFTHSKDLENIRAKAVGREQYGYFKLDRPEEIYDYKDGLKEEEFSKPNFF